MHSISAYRPLLDSKAFIKYCKKLGLDVSLSELKLYQKARLVESFRVDGENRYSEYQFYSVDRAQTYGSFKLSRSSDQLKSSNVKVFSRKGKVFLSADLHIEVEIAESTTLPTSGGGEYRPLDHAKALEQRFRDMVSGKEVLDNLRSEPLKFKPFLQFLLAVEHIYAPYGRSGGGKIQVNGDVAEWQRKRAEFELVDHLSKKDFSTKHLVAWYKRLSSGAGNLLGDKSDWLQIWRGINWSKKEKLEGPIRRGVEYLQWALMLKRILEEHVGHEILDVDEVSNIAPEDILTLDPVSLDQSHLLLRASRNKLYSDSQKNYYGDRYKRMQYLVNDFGLNYQPTVIVFVEGETEESVLPKMYTDRFGVPAESMGIEFRTLGGITKLFGPTVKPKIEGKYTSIIVSNFQNMLSYNLDKWQTIPLLVGDNENEILTKLSSGNCIAFEDKDYKLPSGWCLVWGQDVGFSLVGKDFELANYTNTELINAIVELNPKVNVTEAQIEKLRKNEQGLKQLPEPNGALVDNLKIRLADKLYESLKNMYGDSKDDSLLERPLFKVLDHIARTASLNHAPRDRLQELANRDVIRDILEGKRDAW